MWQEAEDGYLADGQQDTDFQSDDAHGIKVARRTSLVAQWIRIYPPASSGDTGSIPNPGGSHMPWSNQTGVPQQDKPSPQEAGTPQLEKAYTKKQTTSTAKNKIMN